MLAGQPLGKRLVSQYALGLDIIHSLGFPLRTTIFVLGNIGSATRLGYSILLTLHVNPGTDAGGGIGGLSCEPSAQINFRCPSTHQPATLVRRSEISAFVKVW